MRTPRPPTRRRRASGPTPRTGTRLSPRPGPLIEMAGDPARAGLGRPAGTDRRRERGPSARPLLAEAAPGAGRDRLTLRDRRNRNPDGPPGSPQSAAPLRAQPRSRGAEEDGTARPVFRTFDLRCRLTPNRLDPGDVAPILRRRRLPADADGGFCHLQPPMRLNHGRGEEEGPDREHQSHDEGMVERVRAALVPATTSMATRSYSTS